WTTSATRTCSTSRRRRKATSSAAGKPHPLTPGPFSPLRKRRGARGEVTRADEIRCPPNKAPAPRSSTPIAARSSLACAGYRSCGINRGTSAAGRDDFMPDETIPPADSSRPDDRRSPFDGFRRDEFTFHSFDGGQPPSPPADEPPAYYDDPDEDDPDPADVFMAVTVDGQTLKATPAPPVTLGPRRTSRGRQRRRTTSTARQTGLQMVRTIV